MKICYKKLGAILLVTVLLFSLCACAQKYYDYSNISELYDEEWIIGKTRDQIESKYGRFDTYYEKGDVGEYYVNYRTGYLDPSLHDSYFVYFDNTGIATGAKFNRTSQGG